MKKKTKKVRKSKKRVIKGGENPDGSLITVENIEGALENVAKENGINENLELDESLIDGISKKIEEGIENINDYYIDCFENSEYLEFINKTNLKSFILKNKKQDLDENLNTLGTQIMDTRWLNF